MAKRCCDGQCEIVARAGHVVHREQPEAFVHLLRSFTESVNSEDVGHE
jgi:pimeloyl-ACP methyl ester carboxylesterase